MRQRPAPWEYPGCIWLVNGNLARRPRAKLPAMRSPRSTLPALATVTLVTLLAASSAHAIQWKWRDADGRVQYSDRPPPAYVADKDILTRPAAVIRPAATPPASEASTAGAAASRVPAGKASDPELEAKKRKADEEKEAQRKAEEAKVAKAKAEDCERARGYQKTLDDGIRIGRTNAKGEREVLDDQARAQESARNKQVMNATCK